MFYKKNDTNYKQPAEGVELKTLAYGQRTQLCEFRIKKGSNMPPHDHPHEQTGYLVSGKLVLFMDNERFDVNPGDSWSIPENVQHSAEVIEDSVAIEVFSPVREEYLS